MTVGLLLLITGAGALFQLFVLLGSRRVVKDEMVVYFTGYQISLVTLFYTSM